MLIRAHGARTPAHESTFLLHRFSGYALRMQRRRMPQLSEDHGFHPEVGDLIYAQLNKTDTSRQFIQNFVQTYVL